MKEPSKPYLYFLNYLIIIFFIISTIVVTRHYYQNKTTVTFSNLNNEKKYYINHNEMLYLTTTDTTNITKALNDVPPGRYLLHHDTSSQTRYYSMIDVHKGENLISPDFIYYSLPSLSVFRIWNNEANNRVNNTKSFSYISHDDTGKQQTNNVTISLNLNLKKRNDEYTCFFSWVVQLNGKQINNQKAVLTSEHGKLTRQSLYNNGSYHYYAEYYLKRNRAKLKIGAEYL